MSNFDEWFQRATGNDPFPYQRRFAEEGEIPNLVDVPTGLGKTAMAVLGWLWRRRFADEEIRKATPRRLVYGLPMRVLVEQTVGEAKKWLVEIKKHYPKEMTQPLSVYTLMGGEINNDWDAYPEADGILIGTQDQLLSRALNRGYGIGRGRWPMHFALLNNDSLWVMDEVQLMDTGLATSAQLWAFRKKWTPQPGSPTASLGDNGMGIRPTDIRPAVFGTSKTVWMSATLQKSWLETVDAKDHSMGETLTLSEKDKEKAADRWKAKKVIRPASPNDDENVADSKRGKQRKALAAKFPSPNSDLNAYVRAVAYFVSRKHKGQRQLTLVVLNTVERAMHVFKALQGKTQAETYLLHSRFRPHERKQWQPILNRAACEPENVPEHGRIIIATQVVEAGVDISAKLLITELAPWPSLVQRFGRGHRYGEFKNSGGGEIYWIDIPDEEGAPYEIEALKQPREALRPLDGESVSPEALDQRLKCLTDEERGGLFPYDPEYVLRDKDLQELFDTTPDLTGADVDVSRYIRSGRDLDVRVFWRRVPTTGPGKEKTWKPRREELCPVPCWGDSGFQKFIERHKKIRAWRWDYLDGQWMSISGRDSERIYPGQTFLLDVTSGGYDDKTLTPTGWTGVSDDQPQYVPIVDDHAAAALTEDGNDDQEDNDDRSMRAWKTLAVHCWEAAQEHQEKIGSILNDIVGEKEHRAITLTLRLHDWGKAHDVFQDAIRKEGRPADYENRRDLAKAPNECWKRYTRPGFRHELASALAILETVRRARPDHPALVSPEVREMLEVVGFWSNTEDNFERGLNHGDNAVVRELVDLSAEELDLLVYLVAAHHGKVRLSLRASPKDHEENSDDPLASGVRQARGVRDKDNLPAVCLPDARGTSVPIDSVEHNLDVMELGLNATYGRSWSDRMQALRDRWGPFKLAYLEALVRAADWRASGRE